MYVAPLNKNLILQTDDSHDDLSQELTNDDLFVSDEDEIKLDNPESRSSSSTIKSVQQEYDQPTTYDAKNILTKLQKKYGLAHSQQIRIKIFKLDQPVEDILNFARKATNIDLLKKPVFTIDDEK
jgi:hypothetical protein